MACSFLDAICPELWVLDPRPARQALTRRLFRFPLEITRGKLKIILGWLPVSGF